MSRRGENIYKRKDGRWEGRIRKQEIQSGNARYKSVYGKTYREVKGKMDTLRQSAAAERPICHVTMAQAADIWIKSGKNKWKSGTCDAYCQIVYKYIIPCLGNILIEEINNQEMEHFLFFLINRKEERKLSKNYLFQICGLTCRILSYMNKRYGYDISIPDNPVSREQPHQIILPGENALSVLEEYLYHNCKDDTCLGILIAFHTGIRLGELSGLMWQDIDMEERVIYIRRNLLRVRENRMSDTNDSTKKHKTRIIEQTPKTCESMRIIPIPPRLYPLLHTYKKDDALYIISGERKNWAEPRTIQYRFHKILKKCGIESFNFHMLRHAFATRCVSMGLDIKSLSGILGHSNIQMTLNLYVHPTMQQKRQLMEKYDFSYTL